MVRQQRDDGATPRARWLVQLSRDAAIRSQAQACGRQRRRQGPPANSSPVIAHQAAFPPTAPLLTPHLVVRLEAALDHAHNEVGNGEAAELARRRGLDGRQQRIQPGAGCQRSRALHGSSAASHPLQPCWSEGRRQTARARPGDGGAVAAAAVGAAGLCAVPLGCKLHTHPLQRLLDSPGPAEPLPPQPRRSPPSAAARRVL